MAGDSTLKRMPLLCARTHRYAKMNEGIGRKFPMLLRNETALFPTPKLEALRTFTVQMFRKRGNVSERSE